jgi:hypothetical protein
MAVSIIIFVKITNQPSIDHSKSILKRFYSVAVITSGSDFPCVHTRNPTGPKGIIASPGDPGSIPGRTYCFAVILYIVPVFFCDFSRLSERDRGAAWSWTLAANRSGGALRRLFLKPWNRSPQCTRLGTCSYTFFDGQESFWLSSEACNPPQHDDRSRTVSETRGLSRPPDSGGIRVALRCRQSFDAWIVIRRETDWIFKTTQSDQLAHERTD